jgi:hypothetical protein
MLLEIEICDIFYFFYYKLSVDDSELFKLTWAH